MSHLQHLINQKGYEKIEKIIRPDKIILAGALIFYLTLFFAPVALYFLFQDSFPKFWADKVWQAVIILGASVYYLSCWIFLFSAFLDHYLDTWIVTNDRLMNIEQEGVFARTISELELYKIQDTTSEIKGIMPSFFGYGNVFIQTAGEAKRFEMKQVPNPHEIRKLVMDLAEEDRKYHEGEIEKLNK